MNECAPRASTLRALRPAPRVHAAGIGAAVMCAAALAGCATTTPALPQDPYEPFNRAVYRFNDALDVALLKPVATGYAKIVPGPIRTCVSNVFGNLGDLWSAVNSVLQGKGGQGANTVMRFAVNTGFGFGGCIDIASEIDGLQRQREDFGQTLGKWGIASGPYLVLPVFGPSTVRDGLGLVVDLSADPIMRVDDVATRNTATGLRVISTRAELLDASRILEGAAIDPYAFLRDAYLQRRNSQIHDGEPPEAPPPIYEDVDAPAPKDPAPTSK